MLRGAIGVVVVASVLSALSGSACGSEGSEQTDAGREPDTFPLDYDCVEEKGECAITGSRERTLQACEDRLPTGQGYNHGCNRDETCCLQRKCGESLAGKCTYNVTKCAKAIAGECGDAGAVCCGL